MKIDRFIQRVALIVGISAVALAAAVKDGRATLPPKAMVDAYLSDSIFKPTRDDIVRALGMGLGASLGFMAGGGFSYADAIASITNKLIYLRGDSFTGNDGDAVTGGGSWVNEGSLGGTFARAGDLRWEKVSLNGLPGIRPNSSSSMYLTGSVGDYNSLHSTNGAMTFFAVEKRSGSQGSGTDNSVYTNAGLLGDSGGWAGYYYSTRNIWYYKYADGNQNTGLAFTDNVPFVLGIRVNTSGNLRANFNNVSFYSDSTSRSGPSGSASSIQVAKTSNTSNRCYEYIVTADVLADDLIDKIVDALKKKWGIT